MIISKYNADADVYEEYKFSGNKVTFSKLYKQARKNKTIRTWTHSLDELGWTSRDRYISHLKNRGFREVERFASMGAS